MRYPVDNYETEWNNSAGYDHGDATSYGFHDGKDINDSGAGDSDLGKPLYAIANGKIVGLHQHTSPNTFGKHFFLQIDGPWGTRYVHYAHCNEVFVVEGQDVKEGQKIATVGKSGTQYAHVHFSLKKKTSGMDDIAQTKAKLDDIWEDPIAFIKKWKDVAPQPQPVIPPEIQKKASIADRIVKVRDGINADPGKWTDAQEKAFIDRMMREMKRASEFDRDCIAAFGDGVDSNTKTSAQVVAELKKPNDEKFNKVKELVTSLS